MAKLLILLFSGLKFGKLLTTGGTMLLSVAAYAFVFGWRYAVGFVVLLFIHEMGHFMAARQRGLAVGAPTFIPFVGAWIDLKEQPMDVETEAHIGLAGPVAGTVGAMLCYGLARYTDSQLLLALAYAGCFLNLFNLIPLSPFDGGRITAVLSPRIWFLGVPVLVALFIWRPSPILILIAVLAVPQLIKAWHYDPHAPENRAYYSISNESRLTYTVYYIGLVVFLAMMSHELHDMLGSVRA
ncbi:site-2 protease family protein [Ralstonia sp. R-29]|uniref:site-2 protease family protein n=1 Tax=Ralstonia sp. R-29 TaxID=3404059 RepID=UPI003CEA7C16